VQSIPITLEQALVALLGFPALYWLNGLMPWSRGLFARSDRHWRRPFYFSILALHWGTAIVAFAWIQYTGVTLESLGVQQIQLLVGLALLALLGLAAAHFAYQPPVTGSGGDGKTELPTYKKIHNLLAPETKRERLEFVFVSLSAGLCEEFLYRGFGILALQSLGAPYWLALLLPALSFALLHGRAALSTMGLYWVLKGVFYGWLYLWSGNLMVVIVLHTLWDLGLLVKPAKRT
jgi:membrane protease YdiL (CAAX protease family)